MLLSFLNASVLLLLFVWCASLGKRQRRLDAISIYDPLDRPAQRSRVHL